MAVQEILRTVTVVRNNDGSIRAVKAEYDELDPTTGRTILKGARRIDTGEIAATSSVVELLAAIDAALASQSVPSGEIVSAAVDRERERRISSFPWGGNVFQYHSEARIDVASAGAQAIAAIMNGAADGDLRWADPSQDYKWLSRDNIAVPMDAKTCFAFSKAAAAWRTDHIVKARALKDMASIPVDYMADKYWPA